MNVTDGLPRTLLDPERRQELREAVARLALAMAKGEVQPLPIELQALALICDEQQLYAEAARVRRWMAEARSGLERDLLAEA